MKKIVFLLIFLSAFLLIKQTQSAKPSSISGKILSTNGTPIKGIKIWLKNYSEKEAKDSFFWEGKAIVDNTSTDNTGKYEFGNLPEGNYYLSIEFPQKMKKTYEYVKKPNIPIKLQQGQNIKDADYTLKQTRVIISGKVYKRDAITLYANISLELFCNNKIYSSATTNEKGEYILTFEPAAGQWKITIKDNNIIDPSPLKMDLSKLDTFENVNIISGK
ncbi:MAG: carboxypeptidase-like regulatory domain-containing protein [bacterium]|nr:carboxypeptidase-like regulatory domain-containing protein [bacterium]